MTDDSNQLTIHEFAEEILGGFNERYFRDYDEATLKTNME